MIKASEDWNGFIFALQNGWQVSIQQSKDHYSKAPYTVEVAIIDQQDKWYMYNAKNNEIIKQEGSEVNGHVGADEVAKIFALVEQKGVDVPASV